MWVGQAWEEISADKEMIIRSFKKCGISIPVDGSENSQVHIHCLKDYAIKDDGSKYTDGDPCSDDEESGNDDRLSNKLSYILSLLYSTAQVHFLILNHTILLSCLQTVYSTK